ncbi:hypothetical protein NQ314_013016 [Rhamnusium bicolor]|uniref:C2H2-type domain-containing protein n=1 Tax=Rhamnusium bicolor TaxID=1586634 RepID=A0AAV8X992_9CUCU|nr:hypothetical protein NQ314_013016 [Rhamnusium bicolor]
MWTEDYRWHYDYVRLAWDTGFSFEKYKYPNLDKNKICLVDIDRIVKERDVASVERCIPTVVQFILESDQAEVLDTNFENRELKLFTEELENHISSVTKHNNLLTTFKCDICQKAFSTEEYLNSHIKRRHSDEAKEATNAETDKLHSEIKQLKDRLNVTEKLLQDRDEKPENKHSDFNVDENKIKVNEIQERFEKFKEKVENDIRILQIEKNFYEEKYGKLFDVVLHPHTKENVNQHLESIDQDKKSADNISSSLCNIESQMQAFWGKLTELELKREDNLTVQKELQNVPEQLFETAVLESKPKIKPRTKFSKPTKINDNNYNQENADRLKAELEKMYAQSQPKIIDVDIMKNLPKKESELEIVELKSNIMYNTSSTSQSESESHNSIEEIISEKDFESKPSKSTLGKRSATSLRNAAKNEEIIARLREEISNIINNKLQEIGISPSWKGIPQKTYDKAMEIVNHQANLTKKGRYNISYVNFDSIKKSIQKSLKNQKDMKNTKKISKINTSPSKQHPNVINISYRRKSNFDESLQNKPPVKNFETVPPYSAVIEELRTSYPKKINTDSDSNSIIIPNEDNTNEHQTKNDTKAENEPRSLQGAGESTSNVASSILDRSQMITHSEKKQNKEDSFSDFDFSEL